MTDDRQDTGPRPLPHGPEREELLLNYVDVVEECIAYALVAMASANRAEFDGHMEKLRESMAKGMPAMDKALVAGVRFHKLPHLDNLGPSDFAHLNPPRQLQ